MARGLAYQSYRRQSGVLLAICALASLHSSCFYATLLLCNLGLHKKFANRRGVVPGIGDTPNDHHREALAGLPHDHYGGAGEFINQVDRGIPQPAEQVIPLVLLEMTDTGESYRHPDGPIPIGFTEAVGDDDSDITAGGSPQLVSYRPRARVGITRQQ